MPTAAHRGFLVDHPLAVVASEGHPSQPPDFAVPTPTSATRSGPVSAYGYSVVDDPAAHQVVLFGGIDDYDNTWLWNGQRWTLARPGASPPGRFDAAAAYDPVTRQVMVYGGRLGPGEVVCDTWAWTGTTWVELEKGSSQLPAGEFAQMAWDATRREMVLVTPTDTALETWVWKSGWVRQPDGDLDATNTGGLGLDPTSGSLLLLASGSAAGAGSTWPWDGSAWRRVSGPPPPSAGWIAIDPLSGRLLLLAYFSPSQPAPAIWTWSGAGWSLMPGSTVASIGPSEIATEVGHGRLLLFGSLAGSTQSAPLPVRIWAWTGDHGSDWTDARGVEVGSRTA